MDPDVCRNCGHSGKHIDFRDARCAITERDDAERDKLQADAALERARQLCDTSLALMKRQMQEFEDVNAAIDTLKRALAAAEDRRERVRRDCGTHADVCRTARSNLQAAEEMAISAAGRYFQAGRAVTALEEREQLRASAARVDEAPAAIPMEEDEEEEGGMNDDGDDDGGKGEAAREADDRKWQRSNERFCKWLRQSEAQRQILKSSWTKMRVAERLALAGEDVVDNHDDDNDDDDDEEVARRKRVQEWAAARRLTDQLPPEEDPTMETEYLESEHLESEPEESEPPAEVVMAPPPPPAAPSPAKTAPTRRAPASRTRAKTEKAAAAAAAATTTQTTPPTPARGRALRTARRVESQTRSEPTRPTTATTAATKIKKEPATTRKTTAPATKTGGTTTAASSDGAGGRPAARTRARTGKTPGPGPGTGTVPEEAAATATTPGRPQRVTRRRSARVQPYPQANAQPRWK